MDSSVSPKLLLALLLLVLVAPVLQLQARELGGSQERRVGGLPSAVLVLPSGGGGGGDDDDDGAAVVPPKLNNALPGVSRPGWRAPPPPQPGKGRQPGREQSPDVVSSPGVTGNHQKLAPPSPARNPPPHYGRFGSGGGLAPRVLGRPRPSYYE